MSDLHRTIRQRECAGEPTLVELGRETSGDRDPLLARVQVEVVRGLLQSAEPGDRFRVLTTATRTRSPHQSWQEVTPDNVQEALTFLENSHLIGALDLDRALRE